MFERLLNLALALIVLMGASSVARSQDSTDARKLWYESVVIKGLVMSNINYNFGEPPSRRSTLRLYDADNKSFEIALVALSLKRDASVGTAGFRADLDMGPHIPEIDHALGLETGKVDLCQAYISYVANVGAGLTIDLGKFTTPCGYELIESPYAVSDNATHGYLFNYALPFTHTGVRLTYPFTHDLTVSAMGVNGWDNVIDNNESPSVGGQFTWALSGTTVTACAIIGPESQSDNFSRSLYDLAASTALTTNLSVGVGADYGREQTPSYGADSASAALTDHVVWKGIAGFAKLALWDAFALAARAEVFDDPQGVRTGEPQSLHEYTLTPIWTGAQGLTVKADLRYDLSSIRIFESKNGPQSHQTTASLFFLYSF